MANHNQNGGQNGGHSVALPPESQPSWSPQEQAQPLTHRSPGNDDDHDYLSWRDRNYLEGDRAAGERDPRRWEGGRGSEVGYFDSGERPSAYSERRYSDVRSRPGPDRSEAGPASGRPDERLAGRGRSGSERMGYQSGANYRVEPMGYRSGVLGRNNTGDAARRGVGPHRGKGPVGYRRSDERLHELICEALFEDDHLDASQIEVVVKSGDVTLSGIVEDRHAKRDAEDCACSVTGVRDVRNLLRLKGEPPPLKAHQAGRGASPSTEASETEPTAQDQKHRA